ncbi:MAG: hypothetical protein PHS95_03245 [Candidatus Pacebacteria bacterium]|nr:hypothetical protein [Candidatus Paceibacterota bacterium]
MKTKIRKISQIVLSIGIFTLPMIVFAQTKGVIEIPCDGSASDPCTFGDLITLANSIITFLLYLLVPLMTLAFMWIGGNFLLNTNKESARTEAKDRLLNIAKGLGIIVAAFILIKLILTTFLTPDTQNYINNSKIMDLKN